MLFHKTLSKLVIVWLVVTEAQAFTICGTEDDEDKACYST